MALFTSPETRAWWEHRHWQPLQGLRWAQLQTSGVDTRSDSFCYCRKVNEILEIISLTTIDSLSALLTCSLYCICLLALPITSLFVSFCLYCTHTHINSHAPQRLSELCPSRLKWEIVLAGGREISHSTVNWKLVSCVGASPWVERECVYVCLSWVSTFSTFIPAGTERTRWGQRSGVTVRGTNTPKPRKEDSRYKWDRYKKEYRRNRDN